MSGIFKRLKKKTKTFFNSVEKASPLVRESHQIDSSCDQQSPPLSHPTNNHTVELSQTSPRVVIGTEERQPSSLPSSPPYNVGNSNTHLPLPSPVTFHDNNCTSERLRPQSRASFGGNPDQTRTPDEVLLHNNYRGRVELAPQSQSPRSNSNQASNPSLYNSRSQGGSFNRIHQVSQISTENANLYEVQGNQNIYYGNTGAAVLERLADCAMLDAIFDSSARDPPPRCHPGTRQEILHWTQQLLDDQRKEAQMTWFQGAAGVGKSALMQTIAETEAENDALGATLFFSRPSNRDNPQKVFTTIAFQLATKELSYQQYLAEQFAADPSFLNKTIEKQFKDLIAIPFAQRQLLSGSRGRVVLLDGLDECKGTQEQRRIIKLIGDFICDHPNIPLRWIIATRPEQHLVLGFSEVKAVLRTSFWEKEIPIDSEDSVRDVELYLHNEFTRIRNHYPDLIATYEKWPSEKQFLAISSAASGLFVFASTVIRFIDDDEDPVQQLTIVISVLQKQLKRQNLQVNPLALLDAIYDRILSDISSRTLHTVKLILGYLIIGPYIEGNIPTTPFLMCNILDFEQHVLYGALRKLRSVLSFPEPESAARQHTRFLHTSFSDYLKDDKRSHLYSINLNETATHLWLRYMTILKQWMETKSHDSVEYAWNIESLKKATQNRNGDSPTKEQLVEHVRWCWLALLKKHFDPGPDAPFQILLPIEELMEQLSQLDYSYKWILPSTKSHTNGLIECLEAHAPMNHRANLVQAITLLNLDRTRLLVSAYTRPWDGAYIENFDPETKQKIVEDFEEFKRSQSSGVGNVSKTLHLMKGDSASKIRVMILGARPSKCRVLIQNSHSYCLPYFA